MACSGRKDDGSGLQKTGVKTGRQKDRSDFPVSAGVSDEREQESRGKRWTDEIRGGEDL